MEWLDAADAAFREMRKHHSSAFLGGLSMGGSLALRLACEYSDDVAGTIALAAPLHLRHPLLPFLPIASRFVTSLPKRGTGVVDPRGALGRVSYDRQPLGGVVELTRLLKSLRACIHRVNCPLFLAHSLNDRTIPFSNMHAIAESVSARDITTLTLERSNHVLPLDVEREQLFQAVLEFIQKRSG